MWFSLASLENKLAYILSFWLTSFWVPMKAETPFFQIRLVCSTLRKKASDITKRSVTDVRALKHTSRILGHCNNPALLVSHFQASI